MPPLKKRTRGGMRGRGRGIAKRRGPRPRQHSSPATADESDADDIVSFERVNHHQSPSKSPNRKKHREYNEERELSLPRLKPTIIPDNSTLLTLLSHKHDSDYIMTDDELDHVQWELESMLTSIIVRRNTIRDELNTFASMQFARSLHKMSKNPKLPTIRPRAAAEISPVNECRQIKVEFDPTCKELPPNKTESANKFWSMVEPYLAHVSKEDLKWLDDLVKSYDSTKKLYEIPPLGEHYAKNWAKEELEIQKNQSSCSPRPIKRFKLPERISPDVVELVNKLNSTVYDGNVFTPIFRKVVMTLSEHLHTSLEDLEEHFPEYDDIEEKPQEMSNICKEFYAEQSVKKQMYKLGLMGRHAKPVPPPVDQPPAIIKSDEDCDEILEEIIKCDNNLVQLREMNKNHLTDLLGRCRRDYCQQIIKTKISSVNDEILNFKRQQNESWTKEKKIAQLSEEDEELDFLLNQRSNFLLQMQSVMFEPSSYLSPFLSEDSESSDEESDQSKEHIKTEPSVHDDISVKQNDRIENEYPTNENVELNVKINIKQEIIDEEMDCGEVNQDNVGITEHNEQVNNGIINNEEMEKNDIAKNENENADEDENFQDCQTELEVNENINDKVDIQVKNKEDESNDTVKPIIKRRRGKPKKSVSENEESSKMSIKIKQEPTDYDHELDPSEVTIDGIKRELRPRKLNDSNIYFEPYDGTTSEESDFTDLSD